MSMTKVEQQLRYSLVLCVILRIRYMRSIGLKHRHAVTVVSYCLKVMKVIGDSKMTVYYYPTCNTCKKAIKWLKENDTDVTIKHIVEETPSKAILLEVFEKSGLTINKLFNTSGKVYRELNMKDKLKTMSQDEALDILSNNSMLIKRPMLLGDDFALVGFKEENWKEKLG